jgi:predicted RNA-binding Zn-ribbon protein involved in translation (DUF1610 family)
MGSVPWCDRCDRFLTPSTVRTDGTCPRCGRTIEGSATSDAASGPDDALDPVPWHFKLLLAAVALYLGYRAFQGIEWLVGQG